MVHNLTRLAQSIAIAVLHFGKKESQTLRDGKEHVDRFLWSNSHKFRVRRITLSIVCYGSFFFDDTNTHQWPMSFNDKAANHLIASAATD